MKAVFKRYSLYAKTAIRDLDSLGWNFAPYPSVAYVGWLGRGNLGDEAMYLSHRERLSSEHELIKAPINGWSRRLASLGKKPATSILLVGGGTLLGHTGWLKSIRELRCMLDPQKFVVMGAGMEDIEFALEKGLATNEKLREWALLLNQADYVGVRGPQSQRHLWRIGVDSEVVGDAALWFDQASPSRVNRAILTGSPYVAINILGPSNGFDSDHEDRRRQLISYGQGLAKMGLRLVFFGMERRDLREAHILRRSLPSAQVMPWTTSVAKVRDVIRGSELVVSERLHGAILAAAASVPFLMLAYKPKSYDFAESVGAIDACIRLRDLSTGLLMERTLRYISDGENSRSVEAAKSCLAIRFDAAHSSWVASP